jgi:signal transduction histidine kinase
LPNLVREQAAIMRHQVDYYLDRARAAALAGTLGAVTEVAPVMEGLVRTFEKIYQDRHLSIDLTAPADMRFRGERQDLEEMAGNLIDNACKWTSSRIEIGVERTERDGRAMLRITVEDDGPGLPQPAWAEVLSRGRRLDETKPGSGLGLSIVCELVTDYHGHLELGIAALGGLRVELELPGVVDEPGGVPKIA